MMQIIRGLNTDNVTKIKVGKELTGDVSIKAGKTLLDRIRNCQIREICQVHDVIRWGRKRKREWNAHVNRMPAERIPRITKDKEMTGAGRSGRPLKRWRDSWSSASQEHPH